MSVMGRPLKILYVDDEDDIRTIVQMSLGLDPAMDVRAAESAFDALEMLDADEWVPQIALIDVMMPGMNGMGLLARLRERHDTAHLPVVFITASARSMEVKRYTDAGAIGVISKPFDPLSLAGQVRALYESCVRTGE